MYTIVQVGSFQYKVSEGDTIQVNRLEEKEGKSITLDKILLYDSGTEILIGQPYLKNVKVTAKVVKHFLGGKVIAYKFRRRKNYAKKKGFRAQLTTLNISKISAN